MLCGGLCLYPYKILCRGGVKTRFLLILLICFLLFPVLCKIPYIRSYKVDFMLPFFMLGLFVRTKSQMVESRSALCLWFLLFVCGLVFWRLDHIWYMSYPSWFPVKEMVLNHVFFFDVSNLGKVLYRMFVGSSGSLFFISLFFHLGNVGVCKGLFDKVGRFGVYTLHVYILQTFLVELNVFNVHFSAQSVLPKTLQAIIISIFVTIVSIAIAMILEKNRFVDRFLFGKFG